MVRPSLPRIPVLGAVAFSPLTLNNFFGSHADVINAHSHDPSDGNYGHGSALPAWGPNNVFYPLHGPGGTAAGNDWTATYRNAAAIPADPNETAIDPTTVLTAGHGIQGHIQKLYGMMNVLRGQASTASFASNPFPSSLALALLNPGAAQSGALSVTSTITGSQFVSSIATGTAPLSVASTTLVPNLNVAQVGGVSADGSYGSGHGASLAVKDGNGLIPITGVEYDSAEAVTFNTLAAGTSTLVDSLSRLRWGLDQTWKAAGTPGYPTPPATLLAGLNVVGSSPLAGTVQLTGTGGVMFSQAGNIITASFTGSAPASGQSLTYPDVAADSVTSGLGLSYAPRPSAPAASGSTSAGSIPAGTYQVGLTTVGPSGESALSATTPVTLGATGQILVTVPALPTGASVNVTSFNLYLNGFLQQTGNAPGTVTLTSYSNAGAAPPATGYGLQIGTGIAYVGGTRGILAAASVQTALSNSTSYVDWNGTTFNVNANGTASFTGSLLSGYVRLWSVTTNTTGITSVADLRNTGFRPNQPTTLDLPGGFVGSAVRVRVGGTSVFTISETGALSGTVTASSITGALSASQIGAVNPSALTGTGTVPLAALTALTTTQLSASAGILGSQLAASAGILGSQLSASAGILGSQLSATAGILGSQLSATAGLAAGQIASVNPSALTGSGVLPAAALSPVVTQMPDFLASTVVNGFGLTNTSGAALTGTVQTGTAYISNGTSQGRYSMTSQQNVTFFANVNNFVDYNGSTNTVTVTSSTSVLANCIRLWNVLTNGTGVVSTSDLRPTGLWLVPPSGVGAQTQGFTLIAPTAATQIMPLRTIQNGAVLAGNRVDINGNTIFGGKGWVYLGYDNYGQSAGTTGTFFCNGAGGIVGEVSGTGSIQSQLASGDSTTIPYLYTNNGVTKWQVYNNGDASHGWTPVTQARAVNGAALTAGTTNTYQITGSFGVPAGARAVHILLSNNSGTAGNGIQIGASGALPTNSNTYQSSTTTGTTLLVPLSAGGAIDIKANTTGCTIFVDVYGYIAS